MSINLNPPAENTDPWFASRNAFDQQVKQTANDAEAAAAAAQSSADAAQGAAESAQTTAAAAQGAADAAQSAADSAQSAADDAQSAAEASVQPDDPRLPIVMTQAAYDAITPVPGQVYVIQG